MLSKIYSITENMAEVKSQNLLDPTTKRLCKYIENIFATANEVELKSLELLYKWATTNIQTKVWKFLWQWLKHFPKLFSSFDINKQHKWISKSYGSRRLQSCSLFCFLIRIRFIHENNNIIQEYIEEQSRNLINTEVLTAYGLLCVQFRLVLTIVDAKVCNAITSINSTMWFYICKQW